MWWKFRKKTAKSLSPAPEKEIREAGRAPMSEIAKKVKEVELVTRKFSSAQLMGEYRSRFKGQGMQFADFRVYQYGDDIRHIDWRTSARNQETYVKTFEEERELNIFCVVDVSASNLFGTAAYNKREVLSIALAGIAFSAIANNDRVGLILFSDGIERYVPPKKGRKHVLRIIDELLSFEPVKKGTNLQDALEFVSGVAKHNSVVLLASDFLSDFDSRLLRKLARRHDLITLHAADKRDIEIPPIGLLELEDPETGETLLLDASSSWIQKNLGVEQKKRLHQTFEKLRQSGGSIISLNTGKDPSRELLRFFHARKRGRK